MTIAGDKNKNTDSDQDTDKDTLDPTESHDDAKKPNASTWTGDNGQVPDKK